MRASDACVVYDVCVCACVHVSKHLCVQQEKKIGNTGLRAMTIAIAMRKERKQTKAGVACCIAMACALGLAWMAIASGKTLRSSQVEFYFLLFTFIAHRTVSRRCKMVRRRFDFFSSQFAGSAVSLIVVRATDRLCGHVHR